MPADDAFEGEMPDADRVYELYLETCRRLGVEPTPRERAHELIAEWSDAIAAGCGVWTTEQLRGAVARPLHGAHRLGSCPYCSPMPTIG